MEIEAKKMMNNVFKRLCYLCYRLASIAGKGGNFRLRKDRGRGIVIVIFPAENLSGVFYYLVAKEGQSASKVLSGALRGNIQTVPFWS